MEFPYWSDSHSFKQSAFGILLSICVFVPMSAQVCRKTWSSSSPANR